MDTGTIEVKESPQEVRQLLNEFFETYGTHATRKEAVTYAQALVDCKLTKDYKGIQTVWDGLGEKRFTRKDYIEIVKPIVDRDRRIVNEVITKMSTAKHLGQLRRLSQLPEPITPKEYHRYKIARDQIGSDLALARSKFVVKGNLITNAVGGK